LQRFRALAILALLLAASPALAQRATCHRGASFEQWLDAFKREAVAQGVSQRAIGAAAHLMVYDQQVVNKDRGQKVFGQTFLEFSDRMVAKHRIDGGIQRIAKNRALFQKVEQQFGVPAPVIAAFWALETDFGGFMGNLPTIKSVTSLAYDCRRPDLFRKQLIAMGAGLIALVVCSIVPSTLYRRFAYPLLAVSFLILIAVLVPGIGVSRGGARRWIMLVRVLKCQKNCGRVSTCALGAGRSRRSARRWTANARGFPCCAVNRHTFAVERYE